MYMDQTKLKKGKMATVIGIFEEKNLKKKTITNSKARDLIQKIYTYR